MIGLPTECMEDVEGIVHLVHRIKAAGKGKINIRVNASIFVPKPHTPYQWAAQAFTDDLIEKQQVIKTGLKKSGVHLSWQDPEVSLLEGVLSRGDRRLGRVIQLAWQKGCKFDAWSEHFNYTNWQSSFSECGIDPYFYTCRERSLDELLPWAHIETGIEPDFLKSEYERTKLGQETADCRTNSCNLCGLQRIHSGCREKYINLPAG